jgi:hypothetical protein
MSIYRYIADIKGILAEKDNLSSSPEALDIKAGATDNYGTIKKTLITPYNPYLVLLGAFYAVYNKKCSINTIRRLLYDLPPHRNYNLMLNMFIALHRLYTADVVNGDLLQLILNGLAAQQKFIRQLKRSITLFQLKSNSSLGRLLYEKAKEYNDNRYDARHTPESFINEMLFSPKKITDVDDLMYCTNPCGPARYTYKSRRANLKYVCESCKMLAVSKSENHNKSIILGQLLISCYAPNLTPQEKITLQMLYDDVIVIAECVGLPFDKTYTSSLSFTTKSLIGVDTESVWSHHIPQVRSFINDGIVGNNIDVCILAVKYTWIHKSIRLLSLLPNMSDVHMVNLYDHAMSESNTRLIKALENRLKELFKHTHMLTTIYD